jgi:hypothetical protein
MKMGLARIGTIRACPIFIIQSVAGDMTNGPACWIGGPSSPGFFMGLEKPASAGTQSLN